MAGNKYIYNNSGALAEKELIQSSAGAGDAGKGIALDSAGKLDNSFMPTGIGAETKQLTTSEDLSSGDWVNIYDNTGTPTARKADATTVGKRAHGFVLAGTTSGSNATVYVAGINTGRSGLTGGTTYFLAATAGSETDTAPSASGNVVQEVGIALSATEVAFQPSKPITVA